MIEAQTLRLALDEQAGAAPNDRAYRARIVYPFTETLPGEYRYGDTAEFKLEGYQVQVIEFSAGPLPPDPSPAPAASEPRWEGNAQRFAVTLAGPERLALLCESSARLTPRLRDNGRSLKFTTVSPFTGETDISVGQGGWTFLVAELAAGQHTIELDAPGIQSVSAYLVAPTPVAAPPIPAPFPRRAAVRHLFTKRY